MVMRTSPGKTLQQALFTALLCAAAAPSLGADDERWYKVELLVFTRDPVVSDEVFPPSPSLIYPAEARYLHQPERIAEIEAEYPERTSVDGFGRIVIAPVPPDPADASPLAEQTTALGEFPEEPFGLPTESPADDESPLRPTPFVTLAADFRELGAGASRLTRTVNATVQFHETWLQPIPERAEAVPLVLDDSGELGHWTELQGSVMLYRSRYLHIETNLWRNNDGRGLPAGWRMAPPPLGPERVIIQNIPTGPLEPIVVTTPPFINDFADLSALEPPLPTLTPVYPYRHALKFEQRRRMKRNELHYLDHPAMGVVIKITALDEDALESWAEAELMQAETWPASLKAPDEP